MKRLLTFCVAVGLLGASTAMAQGNPTTDKARASVKNYFYKTTDGTFVELTTNRDIADQNITLLDSISLGADLAEGTDLRNVFFVYDGNATRPSFDGNTTKPAFKTVTLANDENTRSCTAMPLADFGNLSDFFFLDAEMGGFAIAAIGGILFSDGNTTDVNGLPALNCNQIDNWVWNETNAARVYPTSLSNDRLVNPTKGTNAPVVLAAASDNSGRFLWAQFDYLVNGHRWLFQLRCYENGRIDYIIGNDLGQSALQTGDKGFAFAPAAIQDRSNALMLGPGYTDENKESCWNILRNFTYSEFGLPITSECGPNAGGTVTVIPSVSDAAFSMPATPTLSLTELDGIVRFDAARTTAVSLEPIHRICLTLTTAEAKDYGTQDLPANSEPTVGFQNSSLKLIYVDPATDLSQPLDMTLDIDGLEQNTEYYIHACICYYTPGAQSQYTYKETAMFGPFRTEALTTVADVTATIEHGQVKLTFQPAEGLATMITKGPEATPKLPDGNLKVGDKIGSQYLPQDTVVALLAAGVSTAELPFNTGERFYLHCFAVQNENTANAIYSDPASVLVVEIPAAGLPAEWQLTSASNPSDLPDGWRPDPSVAIGDAAFGYKYIEPYPYILTSLTATLTGGISAASLITPPILSSEDRITIAFNIRFYDNADDWQYQPGAPRTGDSVRIDYRTNGNDWQPAATFTEFPEADAANGLITLYATVSGTADQRVEFRYTCYTATEHTAHSIVSVRATKGLSCFPPMSLGIDTADVTDTQIALHWKDFHNTAATYSVSYRKTDASPSVPWTKAATDNPTARLTELEPNTAYRIRVQAVCAADNLSDFNATPIVYSTCHGLPYHESLGNVYPVPGSFDYVAPDERGVTCYTGTLGGTLTLSTNYNFTWNPKNSSTGRLNQNERAMGIHEGIRDAAFTLPPVYTQEPTVLTFKLNSFSLRQKEDYTFELATNGATPTEADCRLRVAVSTDGDFSLDDVILTLTGAELNLSDADYRFNIQRTGRVQIAFFFENPAEHWDYKFNLEAYNLALTAVPQDYTLALNANPTEGGSVSGAGVYAEGASVTVTATPNEGYDFVAWMNGGVELSKSAAYTFKMPSANTTYTAVFRTQTPDDPEEHFLTLTASPANGGRISGDGFYLTGENVEIVAEANEGYRFVAWVNGTDTLSKEATYSFKMPDCDTAFTAKFVQNTASETLAQTDFNLSATHGLLRLRNLNALTVNSVTVYTLTGERLARFTPNSREDLSLPVAAGRMMIFVRIDTEKGAAVYKVFLP